MFFLIPLGIAAATAISTATTVTGVAAVSTAAAVGIKKLADKIEEDEAQAVIDARKRSAKTIADFRKNARAEKKAYETEKASVLISQISKSNMSKADKGACISHIKQALEVV